MKAKYSHCMNRLAGLVAMALVATPVLLEAQESRVMSPYERTVRENFWLEMSNPAGIRQDTTLSAAYAELYGKGAYNAFRTMSESANPWTAGAKAEALVHMKRFSLAGSFSFSQEWMKNCCGSMANVPGRYPVDVFEFTPGMKLRQTYGIAGSVSVDLAKCWRAGAVLDFRSSNCAKRKDIRYTDYSLDLEFSPGLVYHKGRLSFGFNYIFDKSGETVTAEQVGSAESSYYAFINKGLCFGRQEIWTGNGVHLNEAGVSGFPIRENSHGAGIQLQQDRLFFALEYRHASGLAGEKQSIWYRFPGDRIDLRAGDIISSGKWSHRIALGASWMRQSNNETVLDKVSENGVTTTVEYGSNLIFRRTVLDADLEYSLTDGLHTLDLTIGAEDERTSASQMFPYVVDQDILGWHADAGATAQMGIVTLHLGLGYHGGGFTENMRSTTEDSGVQTSLFRLEDWYRNDMEYRTADRISAALAARVMVYKGMYLQLDADALAAFGLKVMKGRSCRAGACLRIGYDF